MLKRKIVATVMALMLATVCTSSYANEGDQPPPPPPPPQDNSGPDPELCYGYIVLGFCLLYEK